MNRNVVSAVELQGAHAGVAAQPILLNEETGEDFVPTEEEVREYAAWLGMDVETDEDLLWLACEGLKAPLPRPWRACQCPENNEVFYFNGVTGESTWHHPCDERYREVYQLEKRKRRPVRVITVSCLHPVRDDLSSTVDVACTSMSGHLLSTIRCEAGQDFAGVRALLSEELNLDAAYVRLVFPNAALPDDEELVESCRF